jgi:hypothetical protein
MIAHNLTRFASKSHTSQVSFSCVPPCIQDLVLSDRYRSGECYLIKVVFPSEKKQLRVTNKQRPTYIQC